MSVDFCHLPVVCLGCDCVRLSSLQSMRASTEHDEQEDEEEIRSLGTLV